MLINLYLCGLNESSQYSAANRDRCLYLLLIYQPLKLVANENVSSFRTIPDESILPLILDFVNV